jgi:hypothetical protein
MKSLIGKLLACGIIAMMAAGCATAPKGPSDEEMIMKRVQEGVAAIKAKDYSAFDKLVSNSFSGSAVGDKASFLDMLKSADSMGMADNVEVDLSQAKVVVEGAKCTVTPITASSSAGSIKVTGYGAKEDGVWMLVGGEETY